ncbi:HAMP domain-containing sensor histidine kinase [Pseudolactococcus yaeyamensis]
MIIFLAILLFLIVILVAYLVLVLIDLQQITRQITFIAEKETNAEITSTTKNPWIKNLLNENNRLIRKNKTFHREQVKKDKLLHELLTNLTHDLKTPLTVASGYTQLLEKTLPAENRDIVTKIDGSLASIKRYVDYLMSYNMIQEKNIALRLEKANISEILRESLFLYYESFEERLMTPQFELLEQHYAIIDVIILQRIFQNILGNVLNHGKDFLKVSMTQPDDQHLKLSFSNGLQAKIDNPELLLERFKTNDSSRTNKSTGLGLNIIQELCHLINITPAIGTSDTEFKIELVLQVN